MLICFFKVKKKTKVRFNPFVSQLAATSFPQLNYTHLYKKFPNYFITKIDAILAPIPTSPEHGILAPQQLPPLSPHSFFTPDEVAFIISSSKKTH